jgi:hypothetical protein
MIVCKRKKPKVDLLLLHRFYCLFRSNFILETFQIVTRIVKCCFIRRCQILLSIGFFNFNLYHSAPSNPNRSNSSDGLDFISAIEIQ